MAAMTEVDGLIDMHIQTRQNLKLLGQPGIGKTFKAMMAKDRWQAKDKDFFCLIRDGATSSPLDTIMSMPDLENHTIARLIDAGFPNYFKTPDLVGFIYVGEWTLMDAITNKTWQKLVNHEDVGGFMVPPGVIFIADGNRTSDRSGAQRGGLAVESRFVTYELHWDAEYGLEVAKAAFHPTVAAFLIRNPGSIDNYEEVFEKERASNDLALREGLAGAWACLRSWAKVSALLHFEDSHGRRVTSEDLQRRVGSGIASSFEVFRQMLDKLATMEQIIAEPDKADVPKRMDEQYALSTMLAITTNKESFKPIATYMQRYPDELQAVFFRLMNDRLTKNSGGDATAIRSSQEYKKWITAPHITKLLVGATQS